MTHVIVVGASGHAKVVIDALNLSGVEVVGLLDAKLSGGEYFGCPVLGGDDALGPLLNTHRGLRAIVAIGDNALRWRVTGRIVAQFPELHFATAIHPSALVSPTASIGPGSYIGAGAVINPATRVAAHAIVNTRASIDHDCTLAEGASVGPGATLGGTVTVGTGSHVGLGASVQQDIIIGAWCMIGAGAAVVANIPDGSLALGVPATVRRRVPPREQVAREF